MPRPKVPPNQRRRVAEACTACRANKKRCSATVPCTYCQKRGIAESCTIPQKHQSEPTRRTPHSQQLLQRAAPFQPHPLPSPIPSLDSRRNEPPRRPPVSSLNNETHGHNQSFRRTPAPSAEVSAAPRKEPHSRMLLNSRGERVYIGGAASLSFLQLVRDIVLESIGPSQFSHNATKENMLETQSPISMPKPVSTVPSLTPEQTQLYLTTYFAATGGLLDVFLDDELVAANEANSLHEQAAIWLAIAIGAQCNSSASSQQVGHPYFVQAQQLAFGSMLEDPNVEMVRVFLLMAFYLLGECRRNAAFMYLGVAARAAIALGLHSRGSYAQMDDPRYQLRIKVWFSLCTLEITVCSILGRPSSAVARQSQKDNALIQLLEKSTDGDSAPLVASYKILKIIHESIEKLYAQRSISSSLAEEFLTKIEQWRSSEQTNTDPTVANVHISCLYYFGITLVTRPFLISTLTSRTNVETPAQSQLASACIDAAVYLVQTCVDARKAGLLLGNMCILKALVFAAGLILGFDLFATPRAVDHEIESAFHGARDILNTFSTQSPQAAHYGEILGLLNNAIGKQREKLSARGRGNKHVKRLLSFDANYEPSTDPGLQLQQVGIQEKAQPQTHHDGSGMEVNLHDPNLFNQSSMLPTDSQGDPFLGWDSLDLSQWDNFPFLSPQSIGFDVG